MLPLFSVFWLGCSGSDAPTDTPNAEDSAPTADTSVDEVAWRPGLPPIDRGFRSITHLHSPWSHDACDGDGLIEGVVNAPCLEDLRRGLCDSGVDVAFFTDHPSQAAYQDFDQLFHPHAGDVREGESSVLTCADGRTVRWYAGIEDDLMPVGLEAHVPGDAPARDAQYNLDTPEAIGVLVDAGAHVFIAHSEGRDRAQLEAQQDAGLTGIEIFNLHAMFAPDIRADDLGLDSFDWLSDLSPFTDPVGTAEPDLFVLAVLADQPPSLAHFDALLQRGPVVGIVGTDAHQNVFNYDLRDGDRADSYRRMLRWMGNIVLPEAGEDAKAALAAGRSYVAFEVLGTPNGFGFQAADGTTMGGTTADRTLQIGCPALHPESPRGLDNPEITVRLLRNGEKVADGCGEHTVEPGVYRVEVDMVPHHLAPFLGDVVERFVKIYPWIRSNAIRVQ